LPFVVPPRRSGCRGQYRRCSSAGRSGAGARVVRRSREDDGEAEVHTEPVCARLPRGRVGALVSMLTVMWQWEAAAVALDSCSGRGQGREGMSLPHGVPELRTALRTVGSDACFRTECAGGIVRVLVSGAMAVRGPYSSSCTPLPSSVLCTTVMSPSIACPTDALSASPKRKHKRRSGCRYLMCYSRTSCLVSRTLSYMSQSPPTPPHPTPGS
jgi:hypothetical protein